MDIENNNEQAFYTIYVTPDAYVFGCELCRKNLEKQFPGIVNVTNKQYRPIQRNCGRCGCFKAC